MSHRSSTVDQNLAAVAGQQRQRLIRDALHIFILCNLAVAQPLFDVLGRSVQFFVAERSQPIDVLLLVLLLCVALPGVVVLLEALVGLLSQRLRQGIHLLFVAVLVGMVALPMLKRLGTLPGVALLGVAGILGVVGAVVYWRAQPLRLFMTYLSVGLLVIPGSFLLNPDVQKIVFPSSVQVGAAGEIAATTPVVLVIFDELPLTSLLDEDHKIDPERYPNFARLAQDAYWFRNATTVAGGTFYAIPAIVSGRYPATKRLPIAQDYPETLFTILGGTYDMQVLESGTRLCPEALCKSSRNELGLRDRMVSLLTDVVIVYPHVLLPTDLTTGLPSVTEGWNNFGSSGDTGEYEASASEVTGGDIFDSFGQAMSSDRPSIFRQYVNAIEPSQWPRLYYLHILLPHVPWRYLPSGKTYGYRPKNDGLVSGRWTEDEWLVIQGYQRHLMQTGLVDRLLGELMEKLKATGIYDRALIVVVADHGVSFRPGGDRRDITQENLHELMPVPLIIKLPYQTEGVVSDRNVQTIDILPTIADVLDIELPSEVDGRSVFDDSLPELTEKVIFNGEQQKFTTTSDITHLYELVARKIALFGSGDQQDGLFRIGPSNHVIGWRLSDLRIDEATDAVVRLDDESFFENVDPDSSFVPSHISGTVTTSEQGQEPFNLAVSVNGVIRAVTRTFLDGGERRFTALVPESAFVAGRNDIRVLLLSGSEDNPQFHAAQMQSVTSYLLSNSAGREALVASNGQSIPIISRVVQGSVDRWEVIGGIVYIVGWAADVQNSRPADMVIVLVNGHSAAITRPMLARRGVVDRFANKELLMSGFEVEFPIGAGESQTATEVRVFAVSQDGIASELNYRQGFPWRRPDTASPDRRTPVVPPHFFTLSAVGGEEVITTSSGQIIKVGPDSVGGVVEAWSRDADQVRLSGWAADVRRGQPVATIVAFVNGEQAAVTEPSSVRPDVGEHFGDEELRLSGFTLEFSSDALTDPSAAVVRVFAISTEGVASELNYGEGYPWRGDVSASAS